jgi:NAD(P)-dependent dehydrogenase (short-subunit alcohol dehydrogenase family)
MASQKNTRIALVTGATRGIGRACALALVHDGAHVIATGRTEGALAELDDDVKKIGGAATLVPLDMADFDGIDRLGQAVHERWGRLDCLIGNAAMLGTLTPIGHIEPDEWQRIMAVNLTANYRLIRAFDLLLRQSEAGRALFVSSGVGSHPRAYWAGYAITKAALEAMVKIYAQEIDDTTVRANIINPGATRTKMRAEAMPGEDPASLRPPEDVAELFVAMVQPDYRANGTIVDYASWRKANKK